MMTIFPLSFLAGCLLLLVYSVLPVRALFTCLALAGLMLLFVFKRKRYFMLILGGVLLGFAWSGFRADYKLHWVLPRDFEGETIIAQGIIDSLPVVDEHATHFIFKINELGFRSQRLSGNTKIRLSWQKAKKLRVGDEYRLSIQLKRLHGMRNPGGFDYEAWAFQNDIRASGSVVAKVPAQFIRHHAFHRPVDQFRQILSQAILKHLPNSSTSPWLLALMIGERSGAPKDHWQILRATGTNHLMAIAGLHIGMISGFIYWMVQFMWRRSNRLTAYYPAPLAASIAALLMAWIYSALAGFSIPTKRACIMVTFFLIAALMKRQLPAWHAWSAALFTVLILDPLIILSESFWLSFGTLALIAYGMHGRLHPAGFWWKWGRVQWVIGFGLLPLSLYFFQETSIVSVAANSIAIPWLGFLVLPFCLLSTIFILIIPSLGGLFLWIADKNLAALWSILTWFAHLDFSVWTAAITSYTTLLSTIVACLLLLLPSGVKGRGLSLVWFLPLFINHPLVPAQNEFFLTVLDVGQGLSVVVQTKTHALLYDAGGRFGNQSDMGESVVLPFLHVSSIKRIDEMIISHGDNDHIGGSAAVISALPVTHILTSAVDKFKSHHAALCLAGMHWQWDGVDFEIIYPYLDLLKLGNDSSCVLRIHNQKHSVLLTGDIEKFAENQLLAIHDVNLHADVMTAPHHGSKTSSQRAFIKAIRPQYVIYATGYRNRYHFPHQQVMNTYQEEGVTALNTMETGAIQFHISANNAELKPKLYRYLQQHYWHDMI